MRKVAWGMSVLVGVAAAACAPAQMEMAPVQSWSSELTPRMDSGVRGAAAANSAMRQTGVSITIAGAQQGGEHPWHIHTGTCGSGGPIVGAPAAYPALRPGMNGEARATANVNVGLEAGGQYHVNVHQSPQQLGQIVSCGDLRR